MKLTNLHQLSQQHIHLIPVSPLGQPTQQQNYRNAKLIHGVSIFLPLKLLQSYQKYQEDMCTASLQENNSISILIVIGVSV